jgi:hypothetical protein
VSIPSNPYTIWGFAANNIWAGGGGAISHWNGTMWSAGTALTGDSIASLWGTSSTDLWAAGRYVWHWNGTSWTMSLDPGTNPAGVLSGSGTSDVWVTSDSGAWHYNGTNWAPVNEDGIGRISGYDIWANGANDVWIWGTTNHLLHYNGHNWLKSAAPGNVNYLGGLSGTSDLWMYTNDGRVWHR